MGYEILFDTSTDAKAQLRLSGGGIANYWPSTGKVTVQGKVDAVKEFTQQWNDLATCQLLVTVDGTILAAVQTSCPCLLRSISALFATPAEWETGRWERVSK
jgi:hypothetical protein